MGQSGYNAYLYRRIYDPKTAFYALLLPVLCTVYARNFDLWSNMFGRGLPEHRLLNVNSQRQAERDRKASLTLASRLKTGL